MPAKQYPAPAEPEVNPPGPQTDPPGPPQEDAKQNNGSAQKKLEAKGRIWKIVLILAVLFGLLFLVGVLPRLHNQPKVNAYAKSQKNAVPIVNAVAVEPPPASDALVLPGNIQAVQQTAITARAAGYLKQTYVDIGDRVRKGQLLATIQTPDLDQSTAQARAQLSQAQAAQTQAEANLNQQTAITARASGYLKQTFVDIGDRVHEGQLLATIQTPDLDQSTAQARAQLSQAQAAQTQAGANLNQQQANLVQNQANLSRSQATYQQAKTDLARAYAALAQAQEATSQQTAQLAQAQANLNLARVTAQRYQNLLAAGAIDQQTTDQAVASFQTNQANVASLSAAGRAGLANVAAFRAAVASSAANVKANADGVRASRAQVDAAAANVRSYRAAISAAQANVRAAQANVARNVALQGFNRVTAPFDGIITARNVDSGALITSAGGPSAGDSTSIGSGAAGTTSQGNAAGGSGSSGASPGPSSASSSPSLFSEAQINVLRFFVNIPQIYFGVVSIGQPVQVTISQTPGRIYRGTITRTAGALDASSRSLVAEVRLDNKDGSLRPGMFAQATLHVPHPGGSVLIPGPALLTNADNTQVLLVRPNSTLHFQPVTVGRDFGKVIEVTQGLHVGQKVVTSPSDSLTEGEKIKLAPPQQAAKSGG